MANGMIILVTLLIKTYNRLNIMRKSRTFLDRYSLEKNYISFIRPLMEYADVIWDNQKQNLINKLENIQLDAARIVSGGPGSDL
jgi:uridine kinase